MRGKVEIKNLERFVLEQAQKEISETGVLSFATRRTLWEAMGPLEVREQDSDVPRTLSEPLKKRAKLALECAKKVTGVWCAYDSEDKRPQKLIKQTKDYLDGKISASVLSEKLNVIDDFMVIVDKTNDSAPAAAIAAWEAMVTALEDESLLEPWCADSTDEDFDPYDWDAAKNAAVAWRDAGTGGDPGKQAVQEIKFWAWYLEEAAKLLGIEDFRFPQKDIKAFAKKQSPSRPVPEEVTLESFANYMGGRYYFHVRTPNYEGKPEIYKIMIWVDGDYGICPECKKVTKEFESIFTDCCLTRWENFLPDGRALKLCRTMPQFRCKDHPDVWWIFPEAAKSVSNYKEAFKEYLKGSDRKKSFMEQLESRLTDCLEISAMDVAFCGKRLDLKKIDQEKEKLGLANAGWVDQELRSYGFDVEQFVPNIYIYSCTFEEFLRYYPERVRTMEDGSAELSLERLWVRCYQDNNGALKRMVFTVRFCIWVKNIESSALPKILADLFELSDTQTEKIIQTAKKCYGEWELEPLTGLIKTEAVRIYSVLKQGGVECRILPEPD